MLRAGGGRVEGQLASSGVTLVCGAGLLRRRARSSAASRSRQMDSAARPERTLEPRTVRDRLIRGENARDLRATGDCRDARGGGKPSRAATASADIGDRRRIVIGGRASTGDSRRAGAPDRRDQIERRS